MTGFSALKLFTNTEFPVLEKYDLCNPHSSQGSGLSSFPHTGFTFLKTHIESDLADGSSEAVTGTGTTHVCLVLYSLLNTSDALSTASSGQFLECSFHCAEEM